MMRAVATRQDITRLLKRIDGGERGALEQLMDMVYADLERMAATHLRRQFGRRAGQITLEPAALVNESFLELIKQRKGFDNRGQFFAVATKIMLRVLIDYRRERSAAKRGGGAPRVTLALDPGPDRRADSRADDAVEVEALTGALEKLEHLDNRKADIVKMRIVWGMTAPEVAAALEISPSSVDREWKFAKAWMADEISRTRG
jgi:RNA polymerase sigma factor (TIGR02999 family)